MSVIESDYFIKSVEKKIPASDAIILYLLYNKEYKELEKYVSSIQKSFNSTYSWEEFLAYYQEQGYIKIVGNSLPEDVEFREIFVSLLAIPNKILDVEPWIVEWIDLWPTGVKSGGYYIKSSVKDVLPKMQSFVKKYKYPKDVIFEATKKYIEEKRGQRWAYTQCADYFIIKNNVSRLASCCENLGVKNQNSGSTVNQTFM